MCSMDETPVDKSTHLGIESIYPRPEKTAYPHPNRARMLESWAPFARHECLLHESTITEIKIDLIDSRTGAPIVFNDNRAWELTFRVEFVHLPDPIEKSTVDSQIGLYFSPSNTKGLKPDGTVNPQIGTPDIKSSETRESSQPEGTEDRKARRRRRRKRGGTRGKT